MDAEKGVGKQASMASQDLPGSLFAEGPASIAARLELETEEVDVVGYSGILTTVPLEAGAGVVTFVRMGREDWICPSLQGDPKHYCLLHNVDGVVFDLADPAVPLPVPLPLDPRGPGASRTARPWMPFISSEPASRTGVCSGSPGTWPTFGWQRGASASTSIAVLPLWVGRTRRPCFRINGSSTCQTNGRGREWRGEGPG
jgi:hypothetical protein